MNFQMLFVRQKQKFPTKTIENSQIKKPHLKMIPIKDREWKVAKGC